MIRNIFLLVFSLIYIVSIYKTINNDLIIGNSILSLLTYGSFIPLWIIPCEYINNKKLLYKIFKILIFILFIESILGLFQALYGYSITHSFGFSNGDFVEGTIHPELPSEKSMSNPIFAIILSTLIIFLYSYKKIYKRGGWILYLGLLTFLLASVNHLILFLILSSLVSYIIIKPKLFINSNKSLKLIVGIIFTFIFGVFIKILLVTNLSNVGTTFQALLINKYPKTQILYTFYNSNKENIYPYTGIGPGQFISRASFMASGEYFGGRDAKKSPIPFTKSSPYFDKYVYKKWKKNLNSDIGNSSSTQVQSSWGAFLTEFGIVLWSLLIAFIIKLIIKIKKWVKSENDKIMAFSLITYVFYLFMMGIQQNYWEVSQAIFIGLIISKVIYSRLKFSKPRIYK
jgi:hypothetical protein